MKKLLFSIVFASVLFFTQTSFSGQCKPEHMSDPDNLSPEK